MGIGGIIRGVSGRGASAFNRLRTESVFRSGRSLSILGGAAAAAALAGTDIGNGLLKFLTGFDSSTFGANNVPINFDGLGTHVPPNPNYRVLIIKNSSPPMRVIGNCPAEFEIGYQNEWQDLATVAERIGLGGGASRLATALAAFASATGNASQSRAGTFQIWIGTRPLQFSLPLQLNAISNPQTEIIDPIKTIFAMAAPEAQAGAFLKSPGPSLVDAGLAIEKGEGFFQSLNNGISIFLGRGFTLHGLVIDSIRLRAATRSVNTGQLIHAEVIIEFKTAATYSRDDMLRSFFGDWTSGNINNLLSPSTAFSNPLERQRELARTSANQFLGQLQNSIAGSALGTASAVAGAVSGSIGTITNSIRLPFGLRSGF